MDIGFNKEIYDANGTSILFVPANIGFEDDEFYYIAVDENGDFKSGDTLSVLIPLTGTRLAVHPH